MKSIIKCKVWSSLQFFSVFLDLNFRWILFNQVQYWSFLYSKAVLLLRMFAGTPTTSWHCYITMWQGTSALLYCATLLHCVKSLGPISPLGCRFSHLLCAAPAPETGAGSRSWRKEREPRDSGSGSSNIWSCQGFGPGALGQQLNPSGAMCSLQATSWTALLYRMKVKHVHLGYSDI